MKRSFVCFVLVMLSVILAGCDKGDGTSEGEKEEYLELMVERTDFPRFYVNGEGIPGCLGTQFLGEEPVQLWAERYAGTDYSSNVYLWSLDGKRELLVKGIPDELTYGRYDWYLDQEGCFYLIDEMSGAECLIKLDSQGKELFRTKQDDSSLWRVKEIRQAPDEKVYLVMTESGREERLAELDPETGDITILEQVDVTTEDFFGKTFNLGAGINGPAVYRESRDIREVDTKQGEMTELLLFTGTPYSTTKYGATQNFKIKDFRVLEEGCAQVLIASSDGTAYMEHVSLEEIQRIPIVLCALSVSDWVKRQIVRFNQENDTYYIVVEELGGIYDANREAECLRAVEDYAREVSIRVATGKGPDILLGDKVLGGNVMDMVEKGILEDLRPYMESSGIREEDYFPMVFDAWRRGEEIYGICPEPDINLLEADRAIVGEEPDIWGMTEALLAFQGDMVYRENRDSQGLLRLLLEGSETLWGMVDWEAASCDFRVGLFYDLLEVARRYGDAPGNNKPRIAQYVGYTDFYRTTSPSELEDLGMVLAAWMFEDGCHLKAEGIPIAINANSPHKEAAWEFLCLLLGEEAQEDQRDYPARKDMFDVWMEEQLERLIGSVVSYGRQSRITEDWEILWIYMGDDDVDVDFMRNEKMPYFKKLLEEARHVPLRPAPLLDIICEESEDYFNGNKSAEEVAEVIENRVMLYLNERR